MNNIDNLVTNVPVRILCLGIHVGATWHALADGNAPLAAYYSLTHVNATSELPRS